MTTTPWEVGDTLYEAEDHSWVVTAVDVGIGHDATAVVLYHRGDQQGTILGYRIGKDIYDIRAYNYPDFLEEWLHKPLDNSPSLGGQPTDNSPMLGGDRKVKS